MQAEFIKISDPRWQALLARQDHDIYHLPRYLEVAADEEGGEPLAFYAREDGHRLLIPLLAKPVPDRLNGPTGYRDLLSPYGYPAPLLSDNVPAELLERLFAAFFDLGRESGMVATFLRLHPLFPIPQETLKNCGELQPHGETVSVDLSLPEEAYWQQVRKNHRRGINRLLRDRFVAVIDDWRFFPDFIKLYGETMRRLHAASFYHFTDNYFQALRRALGGHLHLVTILSPQSEPAAAGLFTDCGKIIEYHLGGTTADFLPQAPTKLMFHAMAQWGHRRRASLLHLGGGLGSNNNDGLFHFKAGFSPIRSRFQTFRGIFNRSVYAELEADWSSPQTTPPEANNYFPIYRQPTRDLEANHV